MSSAEPCQCQYATRVTRIYPFLVYWRYGRALFMIFAVLYVSFPACSHSEFLTLFQHVWAVKIVNIRVEYWITITSSTEAFCNT